MFFRKNKSGVSHVVGFMLTFTIISMYVISMIFLTSIIIDRKKEEATILEAKAIINQIADAVIECSTVKQIYPNADYYRDIKIPTDIVGHSYYVDLGDDFIFLNTTDGKVSVNSSAYNLKELNIGVTGKIYSSSGKVKIFCNRTRFVHKFDFGTWNSLVYDDTYIKITDSCSASNPVWPSVYEGFTYRVPIYLINPNTGEEFQNVTDFQVRIQLDPYAINYDHINKDGSDIRFYDFTTKTELPYWIEQWKPYSKSFVWIKVPWINNSEGSRLIYMYYGNQSAKSESDGDKVFLFFDDFLSLNTSKWSLNSNNIRVDRGYLNFFGPGAAAVKSLSLPEKCDIAARARSNGKDVREVSIFCRSPNLNDYYTKGYMFKNGNFTEPITNISILKDANIVLANDSNVSELKKDSWYKLIFRLYGNTYIGVRIPYDPSLDDYDYRSPDYIYCNDSTYNGAYFGLCRSANGDFVTEYDWIAVHKLIDKSILYTISGEDSLFYWWENVDNTSSSYTGLPNNLYGDFVCNYSFGTPATLKVKLLDKFYENKDLVGYWSFEESINTTGSISNKKTIDRSGNRNDGSIYRANWTSGIFGTALELNSRSGGIGGDYVSISDSDSLDFGEDTDYSIEFWIKPYDNTSSDDQFIVDKFDNEKNMGFRIFLNSGYLWFVENEGKIMSSNRLNADEWYHVVLVNSRNGNKVFYINGIEGSNGNWISGNVTNDDPVLLGKSQSGNYLKGIIDEMRIYKRALSKEEIESYYSLASDRSYSISFVCGSTDKALDNVTISSNGVEIVVNTSSGTFAKKWFLINADSGIIDIKLDDKDTTTSSYYWNICALTIEHGVKGIKGVEG